jgi:hypothetical protein
MYRREFVATASAAVIGSRLRSAMAATTLKPMALGLLIVPFPEPEERIKRERFVKPIMFGFVPGRNLVKWSISMRNYGRSGGHGTRAESKWSDGEYTLS